jgi:hypothetical protein
MVDRIKEESSLELIPHAGALHRRIQVRLHVAFEELRVARTDTQNLPDECAARW